VKLVETPIKDLVVIEPRVFGDDRGYFFESYNKANFASAGLHYDFVQDNESRSKYGVLRGLHFQNAPMAQTKLVRVTEGKVFDVGVDLRDGSPTYGQHYGIELSAENKRQYLVPRGFAHGFVVLSESAVFCYKCDNVYSAEHEGGIKFDDPAFGIDWHIPSDDIILSERDKNQPTFKEATFRF